MLRITVACKTRATLQQFQCLEVYALFEKCCTQVTMLYSNFRKQAPAKRHCFTGA